MRAFGPRNSAYAFLDHDRHTDIYIYKYISREISIEHPSVGLASLAQLQPRFCKVDYMSVNVQCPNSTQDNTILMMFLEAVM